MITPDSLKIDAKQKTGKIRQISVVVTARSSNDGLSTVGHEIVGETTSENSYYTLTCSSWPKLPSSVGR